MRYASIIDNDFINGEGVCVSFWTQGCPHKCKGCHNPQTWDFNGGFEADDQVIINEVIQKINKNNIQRNLSILGGEPLCLDNYLFVEDLIIQVKEKYPNIKIFLWTGYTLENLCLCDPHIKNILLNLDYLIDGLFIEEKRDITLKWRGSSNQRILKKNEIYNIINI